MGNAEEMELLIHFPCSPTAQCFPEEQVGVL